MTAPPSEQTTGLEPDGWRPPAVDDEPRPQGPSWGPARALIGIVVALVLIALAAVIVGAFDPDLDSLAATLTLQAIVAVTFVAVAVIAVERGPGALPLVDLGLRRPLHPAVKASALAFLAYIACASLINLVLDPEQEDLTRELGFGESPFGSIAAGVLIIAVAPVSEEVFFRGFVFAGLRRGAGFVVAALISAVVWALLHFNADNPEGSWGVVLQLSAFGVVLAWLYQRTGSLWPPIAIHALNNAIAFAILTS